MASTGELYVQAIEATQKFIDGVRPDQWTAPTPCSDWDVKAVADHIISENLWAGELFKGKTIADVGNKLDGDLGGANPAESYRRSAAVAREAVLAPGAMETTCHLSFGDFSGADYSTQLFQDLLVHGWDIANGTGQDARLDPDLVAACLPIAEKLTREWRSAGVFGEELQVPSDADPQTKLLALFGRRS
jgi:uncharacterized protein (TIGR03086 family)